MSAGLHFWFRLVRVRVSVTDGPCGFTLIELAIVIMIMGVMAAAVSGVIPMAVTSSKDKITRDILEKADNALQGYIIAHGRCPCPDTNADGAEDRNAAGTPAVFTDDSCTAYSGTLPYLTIGLSSAEDSWHNALFYSAYDDMIKTAGPGFCSSLKAFMSDTKITHASLPGDSSKLYVTAHAGAGDRSANAAYVIVSGGGRDMDGASSYLDGLNGQSPAVEFEAQERFADKDYDDIMRSCTFAYLYGRYCVENRWK